MRRIGIALSLMWGSAAVAQERAQLSAETRQFVRIDAPVVVLTHARLVDGSGTAAKDDYAIVIRDEKVAAVGPTAGLTIPSGATVLDVSGRTVIPGIIGLHEHTYFRSTSRTTQMS